MKRRASEKKWPEAGRGASGDDMVYVLRAKGKPDPTPARVETRTAWRFY